MGERLTLTRGHMVKNPGTKEPSRLRKWELPLTENGVLEFYTCARPGRSGGKWHAVTDDVVDEWVSGLPKPNTAIISLLGRKEDSAGKSEFSFYSFCSGYDTVNERGDRLTFQEWLTQNHTHLGIIVREHPTFDGNPVEDDLLAGVRDDIFDLLSSGRTVVVVDSGGVDRTGRVARYLCASEVPLCPSPTS